MSDYSHIYDSMIQCITISILYVYFVRTNFFVWNKSESNSVNLNKIQFNDDFF